MNTSSGIKFERVVLETILSYEEFNMDSIKNQNIFAYNENTKNMVNVLDRVLYKNYPYFYGNIQKRTEFYLHDKIKNLRTRIECKFEDVVGTAHEKWGYQHALFPKEDETDFILIYHGKYYEEHPDVVEAFKSDILSKPNFHVLTLEMFDKLILSKYYTKKS